MINWMIQLPHLPPPPTPPPPGVPVDGGLLFLIVVLFISVFIKIKKREF